MAKEFPTQQIDGDVHGSGTSADLAKLLGQNDTRPVEIRLKVCEDQGYPAGSFGHLQFYRGDRATMSIVYIANECGGGLEIPADVPASRTQLEPDIEIEWVIHPPLR